MKEMERLPSCTRTTMSVPEMGKLLGIKKVESYWLVHREYFETISVCGKMRVVIASFEEWYSGQFHYKKVSGPPPGTKWLDTTMAVSEAAHRLGVSESRVYDLLKKGLFESEHIDNRARVDKSSFEAWFQAQSYYPVKKEKEGGSENGIYRKTEE
jgi:excisionase family DNA binding protein